MTLGVLLIKTRTHEKAEKKKLMSMENLGSLGNVEIYFVLKHCEKNYINGLVELLPSIPFNVSLNNWAKDINSEVDFDLALFNTNIKNDEELVLRYKIGDNKVAITLMERRAVVCIYFRAWYFIENEMLGIVRHLLTNYEIILSGFELDFKYDSNDIESSLNSIENDMSNYPFILKRNRINKVELFSNENLFENIELLNLLKEKTHPLFEIISN